MKYYVLWTENNDMLIEYRNWYFSILQKFIKDIREEEIRKKLLLLINDKEFILNCNNSSRIEYLYLNSKWESELFWHENIIKNFLSDIDFY